MLTAALCEARCSLHARPRPPWGRGVGNRLLGLVPEVVAPPLRAEERPPKSGGWGGAPNAEELTVPKHFRAFAHLLLTTALEVLSVVCVRNGRPREIKSRTY